MKQILTLICCLVLFVVLTPSVTIRAEEVDLFSGAYEGYFTQTGQPSFPATAALVALADNTYHLIVKSRATLEPSETYVLELNGKLQDDKVVFEGLSGLTWWKGEATSAGIQIERGDKGYGGIFELNKTTPHSPTELKKPPQGAIVLLPYEEGKAPDLSAWTNQQWKALPDGSMEVTPKTGPSETREVFGDCEFHMEFYLPLKREAMGQARSNSGVYFNRRYEVQILDSFGVLHGGGDCGGLYGVRTASVNASFPPDTWQTYDATFRAPRLNPDGTIKEHPRLTVLHNGVLIHDNVEIPQVTLGGDTSNPVVERDRILLQDHGNPVRFRNIWLLPLDKK